MRPDPQAYAGNRLATAAHPHQREQGGTVVHGCKVEPVSMKAHVIGAGMAGLSAAVEMANAGWNVSVTDSAARAGGRCRSYLDPQLDQVIDNGNHFVFSGNQAVNRFVEIIGTADK
ncbi:MAG: NAD(P)-binding protein, partial [Sphingomonas sp.]